jgi:hypothetical protein
MRGEISHVSSQCYNHWWGIADVGVGRSENVYCGVVR